MRKTQFYWECRFIARYDHNHGYIFDNDIIYRYTKHEGIKEKDVIEPNKIPIHDKVSIIRKCLDKNLKNEIAKRLGLITEEELINLGWEKLDDGRFEKLNYKLTPNGIGYIPSKSETKYVQIDELDKFKKFNDTISDKVQIIYSLHRIVDSA